MTPGASEPFRGQLYECLIHLEKLLVAIAPKGSKGAEKLKEPIAEFCGVSPPTVQRWFRDLTRGNSRKGDRGPRPTDEAKLRLMCLLTLWGYEVTEFDRIPRKIRNFAELVGFNVLTADEAKHMLGYSGETHMVQILLHKERPSEDKAQRMWDIWMERRADLDRRKGQAIQKFPLPKAAMPSLPQKELPTQVKKAHEPCLGFVIPMMEALLSILNDQDGPGMQEELNALEPKGRQVILQLSSNLSSLSSRIIAGAASEDRL